MKINILLLSLLLLPVPQTPSFKDLHEHLVVWEQLVKDWWGVSWKVLQKTINTWREIREPI